MKDLRNLILGIDDLPKEKLEIPEWNVTVYVRSMTGAERDQYEGMILEKSKLPMKEKMRNLRSSLVVMCTVDEKGNRVFTENDMDAVGLKSAKALDRIATVAQRLNALGDDAVSDIAGNSETSGDADSISD